MVSAGHRSQSLYMGVTYVDDDAWNTGSEEQLTQVNQSFQNYESVLMRREEHPTYLSGCCSHGRTTLRQRVAKIRCNTFRLDSRAVPEVVGGSLDRKVELLDNDSSAMTCPTRTNAVLQVTRAPSIGDRKTLGRQRIGFPTNTPRARAKC